MVDTHYQCFKFEEASLFEKQIGEAYKMDLYDDIKMDNGSNSQNAEVIKVKIFKIKAVMRKNKTEFTKPADYWFNPETGIVYDFEMQYPIGKLEVDEDELFIKTDLHTYVIGYVIPIPIIKEKNEK